MKQKDFEDHIEKAKEFLASELLKIRTGRASVALVEDIKVVAYEGSEPMPLNELGSIVVTDPQSVVIEPWDKSILDKIEEAVRKSEKGLNPINEGGHIRVPVPALTEDSRKNLVKDISKMVENAKITVRNLRQNAIGAIEEQEDNGVISEDDMHRKKKIVEETVQKSNTELEEMGKKKETEVMSV